MNNNTLASGLLAASLALTGSALNAQTPAPAKTAAQEVVRSVRVAPGQLRGKLLQSGTRAPAEGKQVVIRTPDGKEVGRAVTGPDGSYETPALQKGTYNVTIGDGLRLDLNVTPDATISNLDIVMPPSVAAAPAPGEVAGNAAGMGAKTAGAPAAGAKPAAPAAGAAKAAGAAGAGAGAASTGTGLGVLGWSLIAVGGAAAVAVPVAVASSGGGDSTPISGSGARVR